MTNIKTASTPQIKQEIFNAAKNSFTGEMKYSKKNEKGKIIQKKRYVVVPIDCGYTRRNNAVLFALDYRDNKQIKQFIINQIEQFKIIKRQVTPPFPIQLENIKKMFNIKEDKNEQNSEVVDENSN